MIKQKKNYKKSVAGYKFYTFCQHCRSTLIKIAFLKNYKEIIRLLIAINYDKMAAKNHKIDNFISTIPT